MVVGGSEGWEKRQKVSQRLCLLPNIDFDSLLAFFLIPCQPDDEALHISHFTFRSLTQLSTFNENWEPQHFSMAFDAHIWALVLWRGAKTDGNCGCGTCGYETIKTRWWQKVKWKWREREEEEIFDIRINTKCHSSSVTMAGWGRKIVPSSISRNTFFSGLN